MRRLMLCLAVLCAAASPHVLASVSPDRPGPAPAPEPSRQAAAPLDGPAPVREPAGAYRRELRRAYAVVRSHRSVLGHRVPDPPRLAPDGQRRRQLAGWRTRAKAARVALERAIPHREAWTCIHSHEGAWDDPNPPYWGGLQMDWGFMEAYGAGLLQRKGTADRWSPEEQMLAAERAWRVGGFTPWPNTARICHLL